MTTEESPSVENSSNVGVLSESRRLSLYSLQGTSLADLCGSKSGEIIFDQLVDVAKKSNKWNKILWKMIGVLLVVLFLTILAIFGVSIASAVIMQDTKIDANTGFLYAKAGDGLIMKTAQAITREDNLNVHRLSIKELDALYMIQFLKGDVSYEVQGFARGENYTTLLIEGGTLNFDESGFRNVTGEGPLLLWVAVDPFLNRRLTQGFIVDEKKAKIPDSKPFSSSGMCENTDDCQLPFGPNSKCELVSKERHVCVGGQSDGLYK